MLTRKTTREATMIVNHSVNIAIRDAVRSRRFHIVRFELVRNLGKMPLRPGVSRHQNLSEVSLARWRIGPECPRPTPQGKRRGQSNRGRWHASHGVVSVRIPHYPFPYQVILYLFGPSLENSTCILFLIYIEQFK